MPLTEKYIAEYRRKLGDSTYMERAIGDIAGKFSAGYALVKPLCAEPEINDTEEKEMAKNKLIDLSDHLFERIEWMTDQDVTGEKLKEEIARTEGVVKVSVQIVNIATLLHKAKVMADSSNGRMKLPAMLEDKTS